MGLFAEYLVRERPAGSEAGTYGDVQALVALVDDEDHTKIYLGDKWEYAGNLQLAGTTGYRLPELQAEAKYVGLSRELASPAC